VKSEYGDGVNLINITASSILKLEPELYRLDDREDGVQFPV
jgi:hypothetical protein